MVRLGEFGALKKEQADGIADKFVKEFGGPPVVVKATWSGDTFFARTTKAISEDDFKKFLAENGIEPKPWSPEQQKEYGTPSPAPASTTTRSPCTASTAVQNALATKLDTQVEIKQADSRRRQGRRGAAQRRRQVAARSPSCSSWSTSPSASTSATARARSSRCSTTPILIMGAFAITYKEFSLTTVAAILTIIGYSMNDTIVVFDRIRENASRAARQEVRPRRQHVDQRDAVAHHPDLGDGVLRDAGHEHLRHRRHPRLRLRHERRRHRRHLLVDLHRRADPHLAQRALLQDAEPKARADAVPSQLRFPPALDDFSRCAVLVRVRRRAERGLTTQRNHALARIAGLPEELALGRRSPSVRASSGASRLGRRCSDGPPRLPFGDGSRCDPSDCSRSPPSTAVPGLCCNEERARAGALAARSWSCSEVPPAAACSRRQRVTKRPSGDGQGVSTCSPRARRGMDLDLADARSTSRRAAGSRRSSALQPRSPRSCCSTAASRSRGRRGRFLAPRLGRSAPAPTAGRRSRHGGFERLLAADARR